jgi:hypothetical protein
VSKIVVLTDHSGYYEPDEPLPQSMVAAIQRGLRDMPWPPPKGLLIWGQPVEVIDRRPPQPMVERIPIERGPTPPPDRD